MIPDVEERSQHNIERYVGSNLIVKSPHHHPGGCYPIKQQNYRQFQNSRYPKYHNNGGSVNEKSKSKQRNENKADGQQQRYPLAKANVVYRNSNDSRASCWSGYPLISFNAGGRRDNLNQNGDQQLPAQPHTYYGNMGGGGGAGGNPLKYGNGKTSMKCSYSEFVSNKQGVPLIQANKFLEKQNAGAENVLGVSGGAGNWEKEKSFQNRHHHFQHTPMNAAAAENGKHMSESRENHHHHRKNDLISGGGGGVGGGGGGDGGNADENFANSENCLPRIIKPRKRRKKDRKPNTMFSNGAGVAGGGNGANGNGNGNGSVGNVVSTGNGGQLQTMKKLQEKSEKISSMSFKMAHPIGGGGGGGGGGIAVKSSPDIPPILRNVHLSLYHPKSKSLVPYQDEGSNSGSPVGNVNELLISRSLVNLFSEDNSITTHLGLPLPEDLRLENLLGKDSALSSSSTSTSSSSSTISSATASSDGQSTTSFCNCRYCDPEGVVWDIRRRCFSPNLMSPATTMVVVATTATEGKMIKSKDWNTTLKRSCSEPTSKSTAGTPVVPRVRALSDSYDTTNQNLQVSSEIVTSLNGHRDIEIKFFSSSTPTNKVQC